MQILFRNSNQLLSHSRNRNYLKSNRALFTTAQSIAALRDALSTKNNFAALRIIKCLRIPILPPLTLNHFTFVSFFWLNRMGFVPDSEFSSVSRKFQVLRNFDVLSKETEREFISLQIERSRKRWDLLSPPSPPLQLPAPFRKSPSMVVFISLDDAIDFEPYTREFQDLRDRVFRTDLHSFVDLRDDPQKNLKVYGFRDIRLMLGTCSQRPFSQFYKLSYKDKQRVEALMGAVTRVKRCGFKFFIYSHRPLSAIMTFCYLFLNNIDLTKLIEIETVKDLELKIPGRRVILGKGGLEGKEAADFILNLKVFCNA